MQTELERNAIMPITFFSTATLAFLLGMMETCFITCGLYLLLSKQTIAKNDFVPNQPLRRLGGWILLYLAASYVYSCRLIPYIPNWGTENGEVWVPYLNRDMLLYLIIGFPCFAAFLFRMVEKLQMEQWLTLMIPTLIPIVLFVLYCFFPLNEIFFSSLAFWAAYTVMMLILYIRKMLIYERRIHEQHSDLEHRFLWRFFYPTGAFFITMMIGLSLSFYRESCVLLGVYFVFNILSTFTLVWAADNLEGDTDGDETNETIGFEEPDEFTQKRLTAIESALNKELKKQKFFLDSKLNIEHLAHILGTNRTYLGHYFRHKGTNFYTYINTMRIEHACELIKNGDLTLTEIANESGYNNLRTFRRIFLEQKGCLPSEWRGGEK